MKKIPKNKTMTTSNRQNKGKTMPRYARRVAKKTEISPVCAARLAAYKAIAGDGGALNPTWAAWVLDVTHARVYQLIATGRLACHRLNQAPLIPLASVESLLATGRRAGRPAKP